MGPNCSICFRTQSEAWTRPDVQDLNDLRFFAAVVSSGGFSKAARELGLPKSRLSRRVAQLEAELGVRLLERSTRQLRVTEVGREVYAQAATMTAAAEAAAEAALRVRAEPRGLVRLSCPLNLHDQISPRLPAFLIEHPRLRLQILSTNRRVDLIEERVDVAIRVRERLDTDADLQMRRIGVSRRIVVASPGFVQTHGEPPRRKIWPACRCWTPTKGPANPFGGFPPATTVNARSNSIRGFRPATSKLFLPPPSRAWEPRCLPERETRADLATAGRLVRLLPEWGVADGILHLVFTSRRSMLPSVRAVIDFAVEALKDAAN